MHAATLTIVEYQNALITDRALYLLERVDFSLRLAVRHS